MIITFQNFIYTTEAERVLIWQWRNSDRVRLRMINQDRIELEAHLRWMADLVQKSDRLYFLVHDNETPIGVLDFTDIDRDGKTAQWGFYLDLNTRPGFGIIGFLALEHYFTDWNFARLHSQVLASNEKSHGWHKKLYFSETPGHAEAREGVSSLALSREVWLDKSEELRARLFSAHPACRAIWRE